MELMAMIGLFERSRLPWTSSALMTIACTSSVGLMNLSLKLNSIGFYQLCKLFGIPWLAIIQSLVYKVHVSAAIKFSLIIILIGMGLATVTDVHLNLEGSIAGIAAIIVTTQFQIWQGEKQHDHSISAMQINYAQALPTFCFCSILALMFDFRSYGEGQSILTHKWSNAEIQLIFISALLAGCVNLCSYGVIGNTSTTTFQVIGHVKSALIFISGHWLNKRQTLINWSNTLGILVCLVGAALYGYLRYYEISEGINSEQHHTTTLSQRSQQL